jgi:hypothetical protein
MAPLLLLSVIPAAVGFWMGLRGSPRWPVLLAQAGGFTILFLALFLLSFADRPQNVSARYIWTALQYWIFPYLLFLLVPCIVAAAIGKAVQRRNRRADSNSTSA